MLINRTYDLKTIIDKKEFTGGIDFIFYGSSNEYRSKKIREILNNEIRCRKIIFVYNTANESYTINEIDSGNENEESKDLVSNLLIDLKELGIDSKSILIDSTSLKHPFIFFLLKLLKEDFSPLKLFINYSEPEEYEKNVDNNDKGFDLTDNFVALNSIPGFLRQRQHKKGTLLIATLGFEGNRFSRAFEEISPIGSQTYILVGLPSFQPNWQYNVFLENQRVIETSKSFNLVNRSTANDPFGVYNILFKIKKENKQYEITIAPIGTKPHSLGVCMFALDNQDVQIHYDYPLFGDKNRTKGIGQSLIYNLTDFINE